MKRTLLLAALLAVGAPALTEAQTFEVELGGGYVFGSGAENPGPSLPAFDAGFVFWPTARWGIAARLVEGPGEDLHAPVPSLDRTFLGVGHLHYWTVTARHRRVTPALSLELGFGLMRDGHFATVQVFRDPALGRRADPDNFFGGLSLEAFVSRAVSRHFGIKAGLTYDFNVETNNLQPIVLGTVRF
jgi:hypothetical protein